MQIRDKWKIKLTGRLSPMAPLTTLPGLPEDLKQLIVSWKHADIYNWRNITKKGDILTKADLEQKSPKGHTVDALSPTSLCTF